MNFSDGWIVVPGWDRFQHYKSRNPVWIKLYTELLSDPDFLKLTYRQRGILTGIWTLFSQTRGQLGSSPARLGFMLGDSSVRARDLESLIDAGWIEVSASRPLAIGYQLASPEEEKSKNPPTPHASRKNGTSPRQRNTNPRAEPAPSFVCGIEGCTGTYPTQHALDEHRELAHIPVHANAGERIPLELLDPGQEPDDDPDY
jgi:hypothetical protein